MKVISISLINFKKHENLEVSPNGKNVFLLGPNQAGKSSIIDSIFFALNPGKETPTDKIPVPLRKGAKDGSVKVVVGTDGKEYVVVRKFKEGSDDRKITITSSDGMSTTKVEALEKLIGYKKIEPFSFVEWGLTAEGRRKQLALIEELLAPEVKQQLDSVKFKVSLKEEEASVINTVRLSMSQSLKNLGVSESDLLVYSEPIDVAEEMEKYKAALEWNREIAYQKEELDRCIARNEEIDSSISQTETKIFELQALLEKYKTEKSLGEDRVKEINLILQSTEPMETTEVEARVNNAKAHNEKHTLVKKYEETTSQMASKEEQYAKAKAEVQELKDSRLQIISDANLPIPGITFDDEQIYLNGLPMHDKQLSTSQIMKLAFALAIAIGAGDDKLKLLCIPRGESLDNDSIAQLKAFLHDNPDWQAFVEEVDRDESELKIEYVES